jgi:peroxiredoxin
MTIQIGDRVPDGILYESIGYLDEAHCPARPSEVPVAEALAGKRVVIFGLPGAFTPTCSGQHVPGYLKHHDALVARGVDEIWCVSVNDGATMAAWAKDQGVGQRIRMLGDGSAAWTKALGLEFDGGGNMGTRLQRCSLLVEDGIVQQLNVEAPAKYGVSDAETMLGQLGA